MKLAIKLTMERMIYGGPCLGREADGDTEFFVPFTLPGEVVAATPVTGNEVLGTAEVQSIVTPSPHRITAECPHFGACGGCQYQHARYEAQVEMKLGILRETLATAGLANLPRIEAHTAEPWRYRNRIRLRVGVVQGTLRAGYNRRGSYAMLPIETCPIASPLLMKAAAAVLALAEKLPVWTRQLTEMELFTNSDQSLLQITFFLRSEKGALLANLCGQLKALLPELAGAGIVVVGDSGRRQQPGDQWGSDGLQYRAADSRYWVSRGSFFQVNRFLVDELVRLVVSGRSGVLAWDLYAGVGLFSRALTAGFTEVVGVETVAGDLAGTLKGAAGQAVSATVLDFLRAAVLQRERPDLIVMDPPRAGVGEEVCALLARIAATQMVYVSCDPVTLARDLKAMVDSGYTIHEVHLVDLFPQTFHMETVVLLVR